MKRFHTSLFATLRWVMGGNGIAIALLLGIMTNLVSGQLQDIVNRQRYLELLQFEIRSQNLSAQSVFESYERNEGVLPNKRLLANDAYLAGLNSGYLLSIDTETLTSIMAHYKVLPQYNDLISYEHARIDEAQQAWERCAIKNGNCTQLRAEFDSANQFYSQAILQIWQGIHEGSLKELVAEFNPTQDRLDSPLLRLLMGSKTMDFLKD